MWPVFLNRKGHIYVSRLLLCNFWINLFIVCACACVFWSWARWVTCLKSQSWEVKTQCCPRLHSECEGSLRYVRPCLWKQTKRTDERNEAWSLPCTPRFLLCSHPALCLDERALYWPRRAQLVDSCTPVALSQSLSCRAVFVDLKWWVDIPWEAEEDTVTWAPFAHTKSGWLGLERWFRVKEKVDNSLKCNTLVRCTEACSLVFCHVLEDRGGIQLNSMKNYSETVRVHSLQHLSPHQLHRHLVWSS